MPTRRTAILSLALCLAALAGSGQTNRTATEAYATWRAAVAQSNAVIAVTNEAAIRAAADALRPTFGQATQIVDSAVSQRPTFGQATQIVQDVTTPLAAGAALGQTSLQPAFATTGTIYRAEAAAMLMSSDGSAWVEMGTNNAAYLVVVTNTVNVYVSATNGASGYNGPSVGTVLTNPFWNVTSWTWTEIPNSVLSSSVDMEGEIPFGPDQSYFFGWTQFPVPGGAAAFAFLSGIFQPGSPPVPLPTQMTADELTGAIGAFTLDWVPQTNVFQIISVPGTVILISQHDEDPAAHPTLPRHGDVTNVVTAAINAYPPIPTNAVSGWLLYDAGSNKWLRVSVSNYSFTVWEVSP